MTIDDLLTPKPAPTRAQIAASLSIIRIVADAIRDLGEVPSGHLYARLMPTFSLAQYESVIGLLKRAGLVEEKNYLLVWKGAK